MDRSSIGEKSYNHMYVGEGLEKLQTTKFVAKAPGTGPLPPRQVKKGKTTMLIVVDEQQQEAGELEIAKKNSENKYRREKRKSQVIDKITYNNNLHSKYQRSSKSQTRKHNLNLNCLNRTTIKDYDVVCMIGQGAFGIVQRATKKDTGEKVAIK